MPNSLLHIFNVFNLNTEQSLLLERKKSEMKFCFTPTGNFKALNVFPY